MLLPKLIGLYSPAPQCGKSTVANILEAQYGYRRDRFARTMKAMIRTFLAEVGYCQYDIDRMVDGDLKKQDIPLLGVHTRHLMQTLGTEWGRDQVKETMWPDILMDRWTRLDVPTVIDDMRFPNEYDVLKAAGAYLVRIDRPGEQYQAPAGGHASDGALEGLEFDYTLSNDRDLRHLEAQVEHMAQCASSFATRNITKE
jgi:hypothetical protein